MLNVEHRVSNVREGYNEQDMYGYLGYDEPQGPV